MKAERLWTTNQVFKIVCTNTFTIAVLLTLVMLLCNCAGSKPILGDRFTLTINGVDVDRIRQADPVEAFVGAAVALGVHELGHVLAMEVVGVEDYHFTSPFSFQYATAGLTEEDQAWIDRSGFLLQAFIGTIITQVPATRDSDFTLGYTAAGMAQTSLYPLPPGDGADLEHISYCEWLSYVGWSGINFWNTIKEK